MRLLSLGIALTLLAFCGCTRKERVWIYTSIYKEVIAEMKPALERAMPGVEIRWYQGGSENVAARVNTELFAGRTQADLVLTSDPFWYLELKKAGKLLPYESPAARDVPAELRDPEHAFVTVRMPVMVLARNSKAQGAPAPADWRDLGRPKLKDLGSMGNPMESGTSFTAVALLSRAFGWEYFAELRANELIAAGGNSSVINRMETRERPVGMVLLENVLKARKKGSPVEPLYPAEGSIPVPSPVAILRDSRHPELARKVYDWFFSNEAQRALVRSGMYSPLARIEPPQGARPWGEIAPREGSPLRWTPAVLEELYEKREEIKTRFSKAVMQ